MPMLSKCVTLGALLSHVAEGVRTRRAGSTTKMIAGVPVHNYHLAFDGSRFDEAMLAEVKQDMEAGVEHWIAMMREGASDSAIEAACVAHAQCEVHGHASGVQFLELKASEAELEKILMGERENIQFVEPVMPMYATPEFNAQAEVPWGLRRVRARDLANMPTGNPGRSNGGQNVNVYVMDTGIRTTHSQFGGRAIPAAEVGGWFGSRIIECSDTSCAADRQGHGTHCAGTVGGITYGVAQAVTLHAVKVLGDNGSGSTSGITNAMDWVARKAVKPAVASMSLGGGFSSALNSAVDSLVSSGVTVVTAAGNENTDGCTKSPGSAPSSINVGSTDPNDRRSSFSNYGSCLDIWAPGRDVLSSVHTGDDASAAFSGTSMACPHVSGAAAILLQSSPSLSPADVKSRLTKAATVGVVSDAKSGSPNKMLFSEA